MPQPQRVLNASSPPFAWREHHHLVPSLAIQSTGLSRCCYCTLLLVSTGPYVGKDLDYWGLDKWKEEMAK